MAKKTKNKPRAGASTSTSSKNSTESTVKSIAKKFMGKDGKKEGGKHRKKSALWYARELQRLKLKKKFDREKMRV